MRNTLILLVAGAALLACTENDATGPDPRNCTAGTLGEHDMKTGRIGAADCLRYDFEYSGSDTEDSVNYLSYDVKLQKGKSYMYNMQGATPTTELDLVLELIGTDVNTGDEQLLQISDDEGDYGLPQMYFIAPVSGTFSLRVEGYDRADSGNFVLTSRTCDNPLTGTVDSLALTGEMLSGSDCMLQHPQFSEDSSLIKLYSIHIGPNESKLIDMSSGDFDPAFQIFGPGWGVNCGYDYEGCAGGDAEGGNEEGPVDAELTITADGLYTCEFFCVHLDYPGDYTLAVGSDDGHATTGTFGLSVSLAPPEEDRARSTSFPSPIFNPSLHHLTKKPVFLRASKHHAAALRSR